MSNPYDGWPLITSDTLAHERRIEWLRPPGGYLYLREGVALWDRWRAVRPFGELEGCEVIGIAHYDARYLGARRIWFLDMTAGLDGIDLLPPESPYIGIIVQVDPKSTTVRTGERSPLGYSPREPSEEEIADAVKHRDRALALFAADAATNERRARMRRELMERKQAEGRSKYRAPANTIDRQGSP